MSFSTNFIAFLLGGLILPPLLLVAIFVYLSKTLPKYIEHEGNEKKDQLDDIPYFSTNEKEEYENLKLTEIEEQDRTGVNAFKVGWITVTKEYHLFDSNAVDKPIESNESKSAYAALYRLVKKKTNNSTDSNTQTNTQVATEPHHQHTTTVPTDPKVASRRKNRYYGILRHGNLFLYKDESLKSVQHVIVLSNHLVTLWPRDLTDGELFTKRSAICIWKKTSKRKSDAPPKTSATSLQGPLTTDSTADVLEMGTAPNSSPGFYIDCDTNFEKEDWYFELIRATKKEHASPSGSDLNQVEPNIYANTLHFKTADMISLIQTLHSSEGQLYTRWFNALLGRIFLAVQGTEFFENVVRDRLVKKLSKINRPGFLDEFKIKKIDVGCAAPAISFPKLQELNPDGSLRIGLRFSYKGKISIQVATTANINLGSHFKAREVNILLALTVNKIEGPLAIRIKPPPSSRLWYTFEHTPDMDFTIEPVVSQRQITYGMITKAIESRLKDAINDSLVEPAWDDVSFLNTDGEIYRGGIWDTKQRPDKNKSEGHQENEFAADESLDELNTEDPEEVRSPIDNDPPVDHEFISAVASGATTHNIGSDDESSSIKSKLSNKFSQKPSLSNLGVKRRKTEAVIGTSTEQLLANDDYVLQGHHSEADSLDRDSIRSNESGSNKKLISNSIRKVGKWYTEKTSSIKSPPTSRDSKDYHVPEMIQSRRRTSSTISGICTEGSSRVSIKSSSSFTAPVIEDSSTHLKSAPQAHSFPAEFFFGLDNPNPDADHDTKNIAPTKIAAMRSPYEVTRSSTIVAVQEETVTPEIVLNKDTVPKRKAPGRKKPPTLRDKESNESLKIVKEAEGQTLPKDNTAIETISEQVEPGLSKAEISPKKTNATTELSDDDVINQKESVNQIRPPLPSRDSISTIIKVVQDTEDVSSKLLSDSDIESDLP